MKGRIRLLDPDRPSEALEVDVIARDEAVLTVGVPSTVVTFDLIRQEIGGPYRGSIGGRSFVFVPPVAPRRSPASAREPQMGARAGEKRVLQKL